MQREEELAKLFKQYQDYLDTLLGLNEPSWIGIDLLEFRSNLRKEQGEWSDENIFYYNLISKNFNAFSIVISAIFSTGIALKLDNSSAIYLTLDGSLRLPLYGSGVR